MSAPHVIEETVLDVAFDSEDEAFAQQPALTAFMRSRLMPVVDEVFTELSSIDLVLKIDCLEIDLGAMASDGLLDEMTRRLREQLRAAVREQLQALTAGASTEVDLVSQRHSERRQIEHFLLTGRMPWHAMVGRDRTVEEMLRRVIQSSGDPFVDYLKRSVRRGTIIQRLVRQFPDAILADLLRVLVPSHASLLIRCMEDIRTIRRHHRFVEATEEELGRFMWERLFDEILNSQKAEGAPYHWVGRMMKQMALRYGDNYARLLAQLADQTVQLEQKDGGRADLSGMLQALLNGEAKGWSESSEGLSARIRGRDDGLDARHGGVTPPHTGERTGSETESPGTEQWWGWVMQALERDDTADLAAHWPRLLREQSAQLHDLLRHEGQRAEIRRRLARGWPEPMIRDIVGLLEPGAQGFIAEVVGCLDLCQPIPGESAEAPSRRRRRLWECTLTYLLVERGSQFNKRSYLASLIRQLAAHDNLSAQAVLQALTLQLAPLTVATGLSRELQQLLGELTEEWGHRPLVSPDSEPQSQALIQAYDRFDELRARLLEGIKAESPDTLTTLLASLVQEAPWLLLRLARELQARDLVTVPGTIRFSPVTWRQFFKALLIQLAAVNEEAWLRTIDRYEGQVRDLPQFYGYILERLLRGQALNSEVLLQNISVATVHDDQATPQRTLRETSPTPPATGTPEHMHRQADAEWLAALQASSPLSAEDLTRMIVTLDQLLVSSRDRLRSLIESVFTNQETVDRLIDRLPDRLLTRLLYLLRPAEHAQAQRVAALLSTAGTGEEWTMDQARLRRVTWQLLFRYLIEEGRPFVLDTFVRRFVVALAKEISQPDLASVRARLRLHLTRHVLPTNPIDHRTFAVLSRIDEDMPKPSAASKIDAKKSEENEPDYTEQIYIANAGQVLAAPYLPRLFTMLNLTEHNAFRDRTTAERAVHLLQFMVNEKTDCPEYQLVLNKILCGVKTGIPIERTITISTQEQQAIEDMLHAMIQHWKTIGNTSISGLRESFLQREGRLRLQDDAWHLLVQPRAFDMLLDQIPWSFKTIKYPWMERVLHVEWR